MMLEEFYREVGGYELYNKKKEEYYIILCYGCGNIYFSTKIIRCPRKKCKSGNIKPIPFRNCSQLTMSWLKKNFCQSIEELLKSGTEKYE